MQSRAGHKYLRRIPALLLAVFLVLVVCTAGAYSAVNIHHHCIGEHCPVCLNIHVLLALLNGFTQGLIKILPVCLAALVVLRAFAAPQPRKAWQPTPVLLFDRMND